MSFSINGLMIDLWLLYSFTSITYRLWPLPINRIIGGMVVVALVYSFGKKIKRSEFTQLAVTMIFVVYSFLVAESLEKNATDAVYWVTTVVCLIKFSNANERKLLYDEIIKRKNIIFLLTVIENVFMLISFGISECYTIDAWGGRTYYGFGYAPHSLCSALCLVLTFNVIISYKKKKSSWKTLIMLVPGSIAILLSGSRSFLIAVFVLWGIGYRYCIKSKTIRTLLIPVLLVAVGYAVLNSSMVEKFQLQIAFSNSAGNVNNKSLLDNLTSGRLSIWKIDIEAFLECSPIGQLFGNGFDYVYEINEARYGMNIWSHNDVVDLLLSVGWLGAGVYIALIVRFLNSVKMQTPSKLAFALMVMYVLVEMLLNGLFPYQNYLYSVIIFSCFLQELHGRTDRKSDYERFSVKGET